MVELRKRKAPVEPAPPPAPKRSSNPIKKTVEKAKEAVISVPAKVTNGTGKLAIGDTISLEGFGGEIETHSGEKTNLKKLVENSKAGVVLFTYPKASTPGCTTQACLFRDNYSALSASGLSLYGLSTDSPKSNTTFVTKQSLPYPLLCDPSAKLIAAIGMKKAPKGTSRGVIVIDKSGKVTALEQGGPQRTVDVAMGVLPSGDAGSASTNGHVGKGEAAKADEVSEQVKTAETAAEVADSAEKIDEHVKLGPTK